MQQCLTDDWFNQLCFTDITEQPVRLDLHQVAQIY